MANVYEVEDTVLYVSNDEKLFVGNVVGANNGKYNIDFFGHTLGSETYKDNELTAFHRLDTYKGANKKKVLSCFNSARQKLDKNGRIWGSANGHVPPAGFFKGIQVERFHTDNDDLARAVVKNRKERMIRDKQTANISTSSQQAQSSGDAPRSPAPTAGIATPQAPIRSPSVAVPSERSVKRTTTSSSSQYHGVPTVQQNAAEVANAIGGSSSDAPQTGSDSQNNAILRKPIVSSPTVTMPVNGNEASSNGNEANGNETPREAPVQQKHESANGNSQDNSSEDDSQLRGVGSSIVRPVTDRDEVKRANGAQNAQQSAKSPNKFNKEVADDESTLQLNVTGARKRRADDSGSGNVESTSEVQEDDEEPIAPSAKMPRLGAEPPRSEQLDQDEQNHDAPAEQPAAETSGGGIFSGVFSFLKRWC